MVVTQLMTAKFHGHIVEIDYANNEIYLLMKKVEDDEPYGTDYEYTLPLEAVRSEDKDLNKRNTRTRQSIMQRFKIGLNHDNRKR